VSAGLVSFGQAQKSAFLSVYAHCSIVTFSLFLNQSWPNEASKNG